MLRTLIISILSLTAGLVLAGELPLTEIPAESLGTHAWVMVETGPRLSLNEARSRQREGAFQPGMRPVPTFGIGSRPVWLRLDLTNPTGHSLPFRLSAGTTWIDHVDVYLVQGGQVLADWRTGDAVPTSPGVVPGIGYDFDLVFPTGKSELFLRAETMDPMVLPIELRPAGQAVEREQLSHYGYGFLYGGLLMLLAYNLLLYAGLRESQNLLYSLYLFSFILLSLAYTGHGLAWVWPGHPLFQRYVILVLMVVYGCCGLMFANRFLTLREIAPRVARGVRLFMWAGAALITASVALGDQRAAALAAFSFETIFTIGMVLLGILAVRSKQPSGAIFLLAALFGILGGLTTTLAVWGWVPFNRITYHSVELGVLAEAVILALAIAQYVRGHKQAYLLAKDLAMHDPLTTLLNRRALTDRLEQTIALARRREFDFSLMFVDLDEFKPINDKFGHEAGDWLLCEAAKRMLGCVRASDTVARVGGDEFVVLLSSVEDIEQATLVGEKIRSALAEPFHLKPGKWLSITSSIGVCSYPDHGTSQRELLKACDDAMYLAKARGRNRVVVAELNLAERISSAAQVPSSLGLIIFHWRRAYQIGNPTIDAEHHELFNLVNNLLRTGLATDTQPQAFLASADELIQHVRQHFSSEESVLAAKGYSRLQDHADLHRKLVARAEALRQKIGTGEVGLGDWLQFLANDLVIGHILKEDRQYAGLFEG
ncbi:MAG: diguanylate cyclase [Holophagaceae bacterium]|nr:diguanylate cyclase [Holophagaceae bacterium]